MLKHIPIFISLNKVGIESLRNVQFLLQQVVLN